jgi:hypothetical protein
MKRFQIWIVLIALALLAGCATTVPDYEILRRAEQAAARMSDYETATEPDGEDTLIGNDVSDTSMSAAGTTKKYRVRDLPPSDSVSSALSGKHPLMPGVAGDGANGLTVTGAVGLGGSLRFRGAVAVADIPALPVDGDVIMVVDGAAPCDLLTGLGPYRYWMAYSGSAWVCLGDGATTPTQILLGDTEITITDDGVSSGSIAIKADTTPVATITAAGITMGPLAVTAALTSNNTFSSAQLLTGANGGETITQWQTVYFDGTAGEYLLADANAAGEWPAAGIAVAATTDGNPIKVMVSGFARYDTWNWTPGAALCLSETAGGVIACSDASVCSADGDCAQRIGTAITADIVHFNFAQGWAECNGS